LLDKEGAARERRENTNALFLWGSFGEERQTRGKEDEAIDTERGRAGAKKKKVLEGRPPSPPIYA